MASVRVRVRRFRVIQWRGKACCFKFIAAYAARMWAEGFNLNLIHWRDMRLHAPDVGLTGWSQCASPPGARLLVGQKVPRRHETAGRYQTGTACLIAKYNASRRGRGELPARLRWVAARRTP